MTETEFRSAIVSEARSFVGTPYHLGGKVKGAGVDCATLLLCTLRAAHTDLDDKIGIFSQDWFCHAREDSYKLRLLKHARQIAEAVAYPTLDAAPGCILLLKAPNKRVHFHGGIVTAWPFVVHAIHPAVEEIDAARHPMWMHKTISVFDPWEAGVQHDR